MATKATSNSKSTPKTGTRQVSLVSQVKGLLEGAKDGLTAVAIAESMNLINTDMDQPSRAAALKKVRVLARKVVGGPSQSKDGRTAIYKIG